MKSRITRYLKRQFPVKGKDTRTFSDFEKNDVRDAHMHIVQKDKKKKETNTKTKEQNEWWTPERVRGFLKMTSAMNDNRYNRVMRSRITKYLKKKYPVPGKDPRKFIHFEKNDVKEAYDNIIEKDKKKKERKERWTRQVIIEYMKDTSAMGDKKYTWRTLPERVVNKYERNNDFKEYKKRKGMILLYHRLKKKWPTSDEQIDRFMKRLKKERQQSRLK